MIRLLDLISLAGVKLRKFKIHCATGSNPTPLEAFFDGQFKEWQEHQNQRNFPCEHVVSLIYLRRDNWLFAGVYAVEGVQTRMTSEKTWYEYATKELPALDHLVGRAVVAFRREFRNSYLLGDRYGAKLVVAELRSERLSVGEFPGYNDVLLSHRVLRTVVREQIPSWRSALSSVSGVYVIVDTATGKQYVGSACGGGGIWERWAAYAAAGHGGNKELKSRLQAEGLEYTSNFQYSILEVADLNAKQANVTDRESHWKSVLRSREFGYNHN